MSGIFLLHYYFKYQPKRILCGCSCVCISLSVTCVLTWGVRNQSPAPPLWPWLHPWVHHFTCLHFLIRDTLESSMQCLDLGVLIRISELVITEHAPSRFKVTSMWVLSISAEFHQEAREKGSLCTHQEAGDSSVLHRDASALFQFRRVCHYFFIRPSTEKKSTLHMC